MYIYPTLTYSDIFDDFDTLKVDEVLNGVSTVEALKLISTFSASIYMQETEIKAQQQYYSFFSSVLPEPYRSRFENFIIDYLKEHGRYVMVINEIYNLSLMNYMISNNNNVERKLNDVDKYNLIRAYLFLGQKRINFLSEHNLSDSITVTELCEYIIPRQLYNAEHLITKNISVQILKAEIFFMFCQGNEVFKVFLAEFLNAKNADSWMTYISSIARFYFQLVDFEKDHAYSTMKIPFTSGTNSVIGILDDLSIKLGNCIDEGDFKCIRTSPVLKHNNDEYTILSFNFLIDKIFNAIQFDFSRSLVQAGMQYNGKLIIDYGDFKSRVYASEFSEEILFYTTMEKFLKGQNFTNYKSGDIIKGYFSKSEPDFYVRDKGKIFIYEFKDTTISATSKYSKDYKLIYQEIYSKCVRKLDRKGRWHDKGVFQLANVIVDIIAGLTLKFDNYTGSKMIFPILVLSEDLITLNGFNYILNGIFVNRLKELGVDMKKYKIKKLTVISLEFFIEFREHFNGNDIKLHKLILDYHQYVSTNKYGMNQIISFQTYIKKEGKITNTERTYGNADYLAKMITGTL